MNAAIVGAGILGRLLAWQLMQRDFKVTLFDGNPSNNCSAAAGGMLSPYAEIECGGGLEIYKLGMQSLTLWPKILATLGENNILEETGSIILAHGRDSVDLEYFIQRLKTKLKHIDWQQLDKKELNSLEPDLDFNKSYFFPKEAHLNVALLMKTLSQKISTIKQENVRKIKANQVITDKEERFDWVFDCRGLGAKNDIKHLRGVRGELIYLKAPMVNISRPVRLMHPRYRLYIVPKPENHYIIGATEIESDDDSEISMQSALELLTAAASVHKGFLEARIVKTVTSCRPTMPDHLPYIEISDGLVRINGLYRHGFLIAPALIENILDKMPH